MKDYREVKSVGAIDSTERPPDRADVARYYAALSPTQAMNMAAQQLSAARGDSLSENAWALALLNMTINDAFIVSFKTKYQYNLWRPVTAIRLGDTDGNRKTDPDPLFSPFISTPCFPSYPSNHAAGTNSGLEILPAHLWGGRTLADDAASDPSTDAALLRLEADRRRCRRCARLRRDSLPVRSG